MLHLIQISVFVVYVKAAAAAKSSILLLLNYFEDALKAAQKDTDNARKEHQDAEADMIMVPRSAPKLHIKSVRGGGVVEIMDDEDDGTASAENNSHDW